MVDPTHASVSHGALADLTSGIALQCRAQRADRELLSDIG